MNSTSEKINAIYLDANSTTMMPNKIIGTMVLWLNKGNPSSGHASAQACLTAMKSTKKYIANICGFTIGEPDFNNPDYKPNSTDYSVIFTSGASESNASIIRMVVESSKRINNNKPHIIITAIEHKSLLDTATQLQEGGYLDLSIVKPDKYGFISAESIKNEIKIVNNVVITCLICVMHANNETGAINNIKEIGEVANHYAIPFHVDVVQTFGKFGLSPIKNNIDSFSMSFHKMHGPMGCGALVIKDELIMGYELKAMIGGTQNNGLRGGTENLPAIIASKDALFYTLSSRTDKNNNLMNCKALILSLLKKTGIPVCSLEDYYMKPSKNEVEIVVISLATKDYLPNTLMISIVKRTPPEFCNVEFRKTLEQNKVIVSIGSACNTYSRSASHVIYAMEMDDLLKKGILRISMPDNINKEIIKQFVKIFADCLKNILHK